MSLSTESLPRLEQEFLALNERIARLALHLGFDLPDERSVEEAIHAVSLHIRAGQAPSHTVHLWHEFRGLLVLRYQLESRSVETIGVSHLQAVMRTTEERLVRHHIEPHQDGANLGELFGTDKLSDTSKK
jgi:hypothetical protein